MEDLDDLPSCRHRWYMIDDKPDIDIIYVTINSDKMIREMT